MMRTQRHLSDDRLIEVCLGGAPRPSEQRHLLRCTDCEARRSELGRLLAETTEAATSEADAAFPPERLAKQQTRILQRIEHELRPGRVIAFPAARGADTAPRRTRPATRWIAVAAAAGLVIGLLAGYVTHNISGGGARPVQAVATPARETAPPGLRVVSTTLSEDEFLGQIEIAIEGSSTAALRPLDDLTPRVWEVASR